MGDWQHKNCQQEHNYKNTTPPGYRLFSRSLHRTYNKAPSPGLLHFQIQYYWSKLLPVSAPTTFAIFIYTTRVYYSTDKALASWYKLPWYNCVSSDLLQSFSKWWSSALQHKSWEKMTLIFLGFVEKTNRIQQDLPICEESSQNG